MPHRTPPASAAAPALDEKALQDRRNVLLEAIERLRGDNKKLPPLVEKAHRLMLARYWAKANWRHRAQILATSEWLLKLAQMSGDFSQTGLF
jgi:hypothetical protein